MAPLFTRRLVFHTFPNSLPDDLLPPCVPANYAEAYIKLRRAFAYVAKQFEPTFSFSEVQANVDARCRLIQLSEMCLTEAALDQGALQGNLIDSLTEAVARYEARRPCRIRGER
jgi:hypothetical protein